MINKNPREIIIDILQEIEEEKAYSNIALKKILDYNNDLATKDKAFITEITNGTIKYKRKIDYIINQFSSVTTKKMKPVIRHTLRMSVYQIVFLDKIPDSAVCNEAVKIIKKRKMGKLSGFVNGVLRNIIRNIDKIKYPNAKTKPVEYLGVMYSFPDWIISLWLNKYSYDFVESLCISMNETPKVSIRTNRLLISKEDLRKVLEKEQIMAMDGTLAPEALVLEKVPSIALLDSFQKGYFTVQDESSMLVSRVLDPQPGETILDACGAPGGKTTHIAELMDNKGKVISGDIYQHKLDLINQTSNRMGHGVIKTILQDMTLENKKYIGKFDRVLIDAPCSGLGILRKKADIRWNKQSEDIKALTKVQKDIIITCSKYVKPNGIMVYSTCTISELENEQIVKWIVDNLDFELENINDYIPMILRSETTQKGYVQIFPNVAQTDGFFISRFRKRG